mmetsp:Transcript_88002/g.264784  ORF Transcript_88002/g.264784 Transcript_88002/m.264784 type:complete len:220 (-) Transcript_88002:1248-1907(-)
MTDETTRPHLSRGSPEAERVRLPRVQRNRPPGVTHSFVPPRSAPHEHFTSILSKLCSNPFHAKPPLLNRTLKRRLRGCVCVALGGDSMGDRGRAPGDTYDSTNKGGLRLKRADATPAHLYVGSMLPLGRRTAQHKPPTPQTSPARVTSARTQRSGGPPVVSRSQRHTSTRTHKQHTGTSRLSIVLIAITDALIAINGRQAPLPSRAACGQEATATSGRP